MRYEISTKPVFCVMFAAVLFAGCSGNESLPVSSPSTDTNNQAGLARTMTVSGVLTPFANWIRPDAASKARLLYVSDTFDNVVQIYQYPIQGTKSKPVGTLTGFNEPQGLCTDAKSHVYVVNTQDSDVLEYAYGGSKPIATFKTKGYYPVDCSVSPTSGAIAISSILNTASGGQIPGAVTVCLKQNSCTNYVGPDVCGVGCIQQPEFVSYAANGDLYVDSFYGSSAVFAIGYLPHGTTTWQVVTVSGTRVAFPGDLKWDGRYLNIGDQGYVVGGDAVHRCIPNGAKLTCIRTIIFKGATDVVQYVIDQQDKSLIGASYGNGRVDAWSYPSGKLLPEQSLTIEGKNPAPVGVAIVQHP